MEWSGVRTEGRGGVMTIDDILSRLVDGTTLEGPFITEPVRGLSSRGVGSRIEVQAVGLSNPG